jgi:hypothetical protein
MDEVNNGIEIEFDENNDFNFKIKKKIVKLQDT